MALEMARSRERLDYFFVSESLREGWEQCAIEDQAYTYARPAGGPMWTADNRPRYNRDKLRYPSDLTAEWPASDHYPLEATLRL